MGGWGQTPDNNGCVLRSAVVNASLPLYDEFKAKKIVLLKYKYNIMLAISFNINSYLLFQNKDTLPLALSKETIVNEVCCCRIKNNSLSKKNISSCKF